VEKLERLAPGLFVFAASLFLVRCRCLTGAREATHQTGQEEGSFEAILATNVGTFTTRARSSQEKSPKGIKASAPASQASFK
jgi:hypothetical protein